MSSQQETKKASDVSLQEPFIHKDGYADASTSSHRAVPAGSSSPHTLWTLLSRRSAALLTGNHIARAAALVDLAEDQEGLPRQLLDAPQFATSAKFYLIHNALLPLWNFALLALFLLNFVEIPSWCTAEEPHPCGAKKAPLGGLPFLPRKSEIIVELSAIFVLAFPMVILPGKFLGGWREIGKSRHNLAKAIFWLLLAVDNGVAAAYYWGPLGGAVSQPPFRLGPYLRILLIVASAKQLRDGFHTVLNVLPKFGDILALLLIFLGFSSWLALLLFEDTEQGETQFPTYWATFEKLGVLLTGSDMPGIYMPAYRLHRAYSLFFVLFLFIGSTFLLNLVLAVIFDAYKSQLAVRYARLLKERNETLEAAFQLLDREGRGYLDSHQFSELFDALNQYRAMPYVSPDRLEHIFLALDDSGDYKLSKEEFLDLSEAIGTQFVKMDEPTFLEVHFPRFWRSRYFQKILDFVGSPRFDPHLITIVLLLNLVTVAIESSLDLVDSQQQGIWLNVELIFGWLYFLEMVLKIAVHGFTNYWRNKANRFDFAITWVIAIGQTALLFDSLAGKVGKEWLRYLLIIRLLRLARLLANVDRYRVIITTFINLIPALAPLTGIVLSIMSLFSSLGVQLFGGLAYEDNPKIKGTSFAENYLEHNFNDFASGLITLFDFLTEADWNDWMSAYVAATGSGWTRVYFVAFMLLGFILAMNLLSAFVLEAFSAQRDLEKKIPNEEQKGQEGLGVLNLSDEQHGKNVRAVKSASVQRLMRQMLSDELEEK